MSFIHYIVRGVDTSGRLIAVLTARRDLNEALWLARRRIPRQLCGCAAAFQDLKMAWELAGGTWTGVYVEHGSVFIKELGLPLNGSDFGAEGYRLLLEIRRSGFSLTRENSYVTADGNGMHLRLSTLGELWLVKEIFIDGIYNFRLRGSWNVVDVGANIGFASLFFAAQPWINHVVAFEPFPSMVLENSQTRALNPNLASRITLHAVGLDERSASVEVDFSREHSEAMSINGLIPQVHQKPIQCESLEKVTVAVMQASRAFSEFVRPHGDLPILLKLDCEGSEYGILRDFAKNGWPPNIKIIVMEWHLRQPDELVEHLANAGFMIHLREIYPVLGVIIAVR